MTLERISTVAQDFGANNHRRASRPSSPLTIGTVRFALLLLVAVVGVGFGVRYLMAHGVETGENVGDEIAILTVETQFAQSVDTFEQRRSYTGIVKANRTSELSFDRTGLLVELWFDEGDRIELGQPLARLDTRNLEKKRDGLEAEIAVANAQLSELVAGPRKETIAAFEANVRDLTAQVLLAEIDEARGRQLVAQRAGSKSNLDHAVFGLQALKARREAGQRQLDELESGTRQEQIDAQTARVAQLEAALADSMVDLEKSQIAAPYAGTVSKRFVDEGTVVAPGTPVLRIVETDKLEAWIGVSTLTAAKLAKGDRYVVKVGVCELDAVVGAVLPELDAVTRTRTVVFQLVPSSTLNCAVPGQVVRTEFVEAVNQSGFWLPMTALSRGTSGMWSTLVVESTKESSNMVAARRTIEVLHVDSGRVFVRGMIEDGDQIIVSGSHRIVPGQHVTVAG